MGEGVDEAAANIDAVLNFNIKSKLDVRGAGKGNCS